MGSYKLRGLGVIRVQSRDVGSSTEAVSWTTFTAEDAKHAAMCGSKFLADAVWGPVHAAKESKLPCTVLQLDGTGWWVLGLNGNRFEVLFGRTEDQVHALAKTANASKWRPVQQRGYPRWLDCFDNAAFGIWVQGGGVLAEDLEKDFQWLSERRFTACFANVTENRLVAPGVLDDSTMAWDEAMAAKYDLPYRTLMSWKSPDRPNWLWNRVPLPHAQPLGDFYRAYRDLEHQWFGLYNTFEPNAATDSFQSDLRRRIAERQGQSDNFIGHHGSAELGEIGIPELSVVGGSPEIQHDWQSYLRDELSLTLEDVGCLHKGSPHAFKSWDEVNVPLPKTLFGWNDTAFDLKGIWEGKGDPDGVGRDQKWFEEGTVTAWNPIDCSDPMILAYKEKKKGGGAVLNSTFWLKRKITLSKDQAEHLSYFHLSRARWYHYYENGAKPLEVYVNGRLSKNLTASIPLREDDDLCFDLSPLLHEGENSIVINTQGAVVPSYIFLSKEGRWEYPSADPIKNRLYYDMTNFAVHLRMKHLEDTLKALRSGDPFRPIKVMSPYFCVDGVLDLCERYGAYVHDTGQNGECWAPWLSRFAVGRGQVVSSEPGGPARNADDIRRNLTFYLMMGNSAVDMVFHPQSYRTTPDIAKWIDEHLELIRCIGKMKMEPPAIGILRSTRDVRLKFAAPWGWDLGRGELQSVGRTFNYAELQDVTSGRVDQQYKVLIDDGTAVFTEEEIDALERYVRQGGTFVVMHNTGMHTPEHAWSWPISRLTGLRVVSRGGKGTLHFRADQDLWPKLQDLELGGQGLILDWMQRDQTGESLYLQQHDQEVKVVAEWSGRKENEGRIAIAYRNLGKGKVVTLGSSFWRKARDYSGRYQADDGTEVYLNELLDSLGVARESWRTGGEATGDVFVEHWRSKNGIFDLYPVARIVQTATDPVTLDVSWRRSAPTASLYEISAAGNPRREVQWKDNVMTLGKVSLVPMESRVFAASRPDVEKSPLYWIETQQRQWPMLATISDDEKPPLQPAVADVLPLQEAWMFEAGEAWNVVPPVVNSPDAYPVRLGTFAVLGLPEDAVVHFRKAVQIPKEWAGQRIFLRFDAEKWFWGIRPSGRLWINGHISPFPVTGDQTSSFSIEVTNDVHDGTVDFALEVDGRVKNDAARKGRPSGVTGAFYLQAEPQPVATQQLTDWKGGIDVWATLYIGSEPKPACSYLETRFTMPASWPAHRLHLETSNRQLSWLMLNDQVVQSPGWMQSIDISRLVRRNGENVLRWIPNTTAAGTSPVSLYKTFVPNEKAIDLKLRWLPK
ncbi:MAG: hypothetical protein ACFUZC_10430 [Chthoniobacteraceae bacterium]